MTDPTQSSRPGVPPASGGGAARGPDADDPAPDRPDRAAPPDRSEPHPHTEAPPLPGDGGAESLGDWLRALFRGRTNGEGSVRDTLEEIIEERDEAELPIDAHERLLITNVLHQRDMTAEDVMVPRPDIVALGEDATLAEIAALMAEKGHSRMPVFRETLDTIIGMVHIKDLIPYLHRGERADLAALARAVLFVSPSMRVLDLLLEMRLKRTHMALVVDEYGGIDGLVTIEDLVEQIVGEIEDEHDVQTEPELVVHDDGSVVADARLDLEDFEGRFGAFLSDAEREETDTLAGLVFRLAGRVPGRGELIVHDSGMEFEIMEADPRRIKRLRLRNLPTEAVTGTGTGAP
ncbi:hemolysin family protein [Roseospira goensis]|uniref:CBS domain containing-hemolysin-like protein n=1 Tax=Roseospira goensis TaxID=391922 RepID=A0A7W6RW59_9PROT|nr:hemolysin family protein [Roseospira goensis]MBB4284359.1 CBS domain containing-hemolysin-like protein [Roseospira goensis]